MVVRGATAEEARARKHEELSPLLEEEYDLFHSNNFIVNAAFHSLFTKRTMEEQKDMSNNSIEAWLQSVHSAKYSTKKYFRHPSRDQLVNSSLSRRRKLLPTLLAR